jgi:dTDP-4-amino-4,6-dideoxygalactose transaminase
MPHPVSRLALHGGKPVRSHSRFLVFGAPPLGDEEIAGVVDSLRKRWIGTGPKVAQFEAAFAAYKGMPHAVAVNSCTAALHLAMLALDIGPGDEVLVPTLTFCATANAVLHAGAIPVPVDVQRETMNFDPVDAESKVTRRTKAMIPVHFAGRACDMRALQALAKKYRLRIIEDCAHAIETENHGVKAGTVGDLACFSFYATKNLTTGEGGMLLTRSAAIAARLKRLALHGMSQDAWKRFSDSGYKHYDVVDLGYKYNLTDLAAAIGLPQLKAVERNWLRRQAIWKQYQMAFADLQAKGMVQLPAEPETHERHAYHLYTPLIGRPKANGAAGKRLASRRDFALSALTAEGIGVGVHYRSLSDHPLYRKRLKWKRADAPVAGDIGDRTVSLPLSPSLSDGDVQDVIRAFRKVLEHQAEHQGEP